MATYLYADVVDDELRDRSEVERAACSRAAKRRGRRLAALGFLFALGSVLANVPYAEEEEVVTMRNVATFVGIAVVVAVLAIGSARLTGRRRRPVESW